MMRGLPGRHLPPRAQRAFEAINRGVLSSLEEDPGLRLAATTARSAGTYTGGGLNVQTFLRPPAGPNDAASLELAPVSVNARRAMSRTRGSVIDVL
jgi:hypothetical protein